MKIKTLLIILFLQMSGLSYAEVYSVWKNNRIYFYEENGKEIEWWINGKNTIAHLFRGEINGPVKSWRTYNDETLITTINFCNKKKCNGEYVWRDEKNRIIFKESYKNDLLNGKCSTYYKNGKLKTEADMKDNKIDGKFCIYYDTGIMKSITNYRNGKKHGNYEQFFSTGQKEITASYVNGKLNGEYILYNDKGKIINQIEYKNGLRDGITKMFDQEGRLEIENMYKNDKLHGTCKEYYKSEKIKEVAEVDRKGGAYFTEYYESGAVKEKGYYSEPGIKKGKYTRFNEKGEQIEKGEY